MHLRVSWRTQPTNFTKKTKQKTRWDTVVTGGTRLGNANTAGDYELRGPACGASHSRDSGGRQLQSVLTKEVELVKHDELVAKLVKLHQHDRRRESHRAVFQSSASVWVAAWPTPTCRMSNSQLAVHAACWYMGVQVGHDLPTEVFVTCYFSARSPETHPLGCI
jgi:hypothetical protein